MSITRVRVLATKLVNKLPNRLRRVIYKGIIETRFIYFKTKMLFFTHTSRRNIPDPSKIYWISPKRIVCHTNFLKTADSAATPFFDRVFPPEMRGKTVDGDWDITDWVFTDLTVYKALQERILEGAMWQDTDFYVKVLERIKSGRFVWGIKNEADLEKRCRYIDSLYENIRTKGYRLNRTVCDGNIEYDEIDVNIGRNGEYLFQNGVHRLSIARILGLRSVPVMVFVRHKKWLDFRESVVFYARQQRKHKLFQPIAHPDLADIPYDDDNDSEGLVEAIKSHLRKGEGTMLDVGASLGFFCHKFEDLGYKCCAVEADPGTFQMLEKIRIAENKRFVTINSSIFDVTSIRGTKFDVVLALNIFHHFLKKETDFCKLKDLLANLNMDIMFFEPHNPQEHQMKGAFLNYEPIEFVDFILRNTSLRKSEAIYTAKNGRTLFKLSK